MTQHADPAAFAPAAVHPAAVPPGTAPAGHPRIHVPAQNSGGSPPGAPLSPPVGFGPLPMPHFEQHPVAYPQPEPPMNTMAVLSVITAFVVSPVAIVLGILARKQIDRTGERGRPLAILGTVLGAVFSAVGVATTIAVLVLAGSTAAAIEAGTTSPTPSASAAPSLPSRAAPALPAAPAAPAPSSGTTTDGASATAQLYSAYAELDSAAVTLNEGMDAHEGDFTALKADLAQFQAAMETFTNTVAGIPFPAAQQARVDAELLPAAEATIVELDTMTSTSSRSTFADRADDFGDKLITMDRIAKDILAG